ERLAELWRGEADAGRSAHGRGEVVEQPVQEPAEAFDRFAAHAKARIAEQDDGADAHGAEFTGRVERPPGSALRFAQATPDGVDSAMSSATSAGTSAMSAASVAVPAAFALAAAASRRSSTARSRERSASFWPALPVISAARWATGPAFSPAIAASSAALAPMSRTTGAACVARFSIIAWSWVSHSRALSPRSVLEASGS